MNRLSNIYILFNLIWAMMVFIPSIQGQNTIELSFEEGEQIGIKTNNYSNWITKGNSIDGNHYVSLDPNTEFGPTIYLTKKLNPNSWIKAEVWRKNSGNLVVSCESLAIYHSSNQVTETKKDWQRIENWIQVPHNYKGEEIRIYFHNAEMQEVAMDKMIISFHKFYPYPKVKELPQVNLDLNEEAMNRFQERKMKALEIGTITDELKKWEKAEVSQDNSISKVKVRFKGDWTDHLTNDKWSFRVKVKDEKKVLGLNTFSLQNPSTRYFLSEWLLHQLASEEDLVNTKYDFVQFNLNGESKGIYAMEQHFTSNLLLRFNRPVAPILKFEETGFWEMIRTEKKQNYVQNYYQFDVANIVPFEKKKVFSDSTLNQQFLDASWALNHWHNLNPSIHGYVDKEKFAAFLALTDLFESYHSLYWINLRFYRNPSSRKLEPVLYDGFTEEGSVAPLNSVDILGNIDKDHDTIYHKTQMVIYQFFQDEEFRRLYFSKMEKFSSEEFILGVKEEYGNEWLKYESMLQREFSTYQFNFERIERRAAEIRDILTDTAQLIRSEYYPEYESMWDWNERVGEMPEMNDSTYFPAFGLKAVKVKSGINLVNCHPQELIIIGYSLNKEKVMFASEKQVKVLAYNPSKGGVLTHFPYDADKIYYTTAGEKRNVKVLKNGCLPINWNIKP